METRGLPPSTAEKTAVGASQSWIVCLFDERIIDIYIYILFKLFNRSPVSSSSSVFLFLICERLKLLRSSLLDPEAAVGKRSSFAEESIDKRKNNEMVGAFMLLSFKALLG